MILWWREPWNLSLRLGGLWDLSEHLNSFNGSLTDRFDLICSHVVHDVKQVSLESRQRLLQNGSECIDHIDGHLADRPILPRGVILRYEIHQDGQEGLAVRIVSLLNCEDQGDHRFQKLRMTLAQTTRGGQVVQKLPIDKAERGLERLERRILYHFCQTQSCPLL
jgi:hypothetical protein